MAEAALLGGDARGQSMLRRIEALLARRPPHVHRLAELVDAVDQVERGLAMCRLHGGVVVVLPVVVIQHMTTGAARAVAAPEGIEGGRRRLQRGARHLIEVLVGAGQPQRVIGAKASHRSVDRLHRRRRRRAAEQRACVGETEAAGIAGCRADSAERRLDRRRGCRRFRRAA